MHNLLDEFFMIFQFAFKEQNIKFSYYVTKHLTKDIFFDTERYLEVLFHLIMNSIKFK